MSLTITTRALQLVEKSLAELKPDPRNAREHSNKQIDQIAASIIQFGFTNPILTDEHAEIIAGHGRLLAARQLGLKTVPTIAVEGLSDAHKRALRIADNKIALNAGWDFDMLSVELKELGDLELDFDLEVTGFEAPEIDVITLETASAPEDDLERFEAPQRARSGDIWTLGKHRLGCGDARDVEFVKRVVNDPTGVDAVFVDPPYNVKINGNAISAGRHDEFAMASGEMSDAEFQGFLQVSFSALASVLKKGAVHFICMDWRHMGSVLGAGKAIYDSLLNLCVWNKSNGGMGSLYRSKNELVFVYRFGEAKHFNGVHLGKYGRNRTNVWDYPSVNTGTGKRSKDLRLHPTVKPVALVEDALRDVTKQGDLVLDSFLGSGTTLLAADRVNRRCRGIEFEPSYVDVALERWSQLHDLDPQLAYRVQA